MKHLFWAMMLLMPGVSTGEGLLAFRNDLAFDSRAVEAVAERVYRERLGRFAAKGHLDGDAELLSRLRRTVERLLPAVQLERPGAAAIHWEIHTCRQCGESASAMAGGRLLVGEEFIAELALTDDELGYMIAHEMAHVLAEHTREFATNARFLLDNGRNRYYEDIQNELDESFVVNLRMAPMYASQELEADYMGFILGARSGFDPEAMPRMLRKLHADGPSGFSLHPDAKTRIARAQSMLQIAHRVQRMGMQQR